MIITNYSTKIGIARLLALIGVEENYKEITEINGYNYSYCSKLGCDMCHLIHSIKDEQQKGVFINNTCIKNCPNINKKIKLYRNEKNSYKIKKISLLSKSQLKQYIYYHSMCDSFGGVFNLSAKSIANELKYTERTIKKNNDFFVDNNLICLGKMGTDCFSLFIPGYKDYFKTKSEYGSGYLDLSKEVVIKLLRATNVADIRLNLRKLIKCSKLIKSNNINYVVETYESLKRILPSYINCPKKINYFIKNSKVDIFSTEFTDNGIKYRLKDQFNNYMIKDMKSKDYQFAIVDHIYRSARRMGLELVGEPINDIFSLTDLYDYVKDFVQMSIQYDLQCVLDALDYLLLIMIRDDFNGNYGAVVRNRIRDVIYGQAISI